MASHSYFFFDDDNNNTMLCKKSQKSRVSCEKLSQYAENLHVSPSNANWIVKRCITRYDAYWTEVTYNKQEGSVPLILCCDHPREWSLMWKGKVICVIGFPGVYLRTGICLAFYLGHFVHQLFELEKPVWRGVENRRLGRYLVSYSAEFHQNLLVHSSTRLAYATFLVRMNIQPLIYSEEGLNTLTMIEEDQKNFPE